MRSKAYGKIRELGGEALYRRGSLWGCSCDVLAAFPTHRPFPYCSRMNSDPSMPRRMPPPSSGGCARCWAGATGRIRSISTWPCATPCWRGQRLQEPHPPQEAAGQADAEACLRRQRREVRGPGPRRACLRRTLPTTCAAWSGSEADPPRCEMRHEKRGELRRARHSQTEQSRAQIPFTIRSSARKPGSWRCPLSVWQMDSLESVQ
jgi:hypothetical protein